MTGTKLHYYGKSLPGRFSQGYIASFIHAFGRSVTESFLSEAAFSAIQDNESYKAFLKSTRHVVSPNAIEDLDYSIIRLFYEGLSHGYSRPGHRCFKERMRFIGRIWCVKGDINMPGYEFESISEIVMNSTDIDIKTIQGDLCIADQYVQSFFSIFSRESSISIDMLFEREKSTLKLVNCPFCSDVTPPCEFFWGIVEGFIIWLRETLGLENLSINYSDSKGHTIIIQNSNKNL